MKIHSDQQKTLLAPFEDISAVAGSTRFIEDKLIFGNI